MGLRINRGGLGDNAPNFVEPNNNPKQAAAAWLTDYTAPQSTGGSTLTFNGPPTIRPATKKKTTLKRTGAAGPMLDKVFPLAVDDAGKKTIFGMPAALVYVAGGILSATLIAVLIRMLRGGGGRRRRASNPKRARTARGAQR